MRFVIPPLALLLSAAALALPHATLASEPALVLETVDVPSSTASQEITVTPKVRTTGDTACVYMRIANEDGEWGSAGYPLNGCRAHKHTLSKGDGIKGVFVQVQGAEHLGGDKYRSVESNIIFVKLRKVADAAQAPDPKPDPKPDPDPIDNAPTITSSSVELPDPQYVNNPMATPAQYHPHLNVTFTGGENCSITDYAYKIAPDVEWSTVYRQRPYVTNLITRTGKQNISVQLFGTCGEEAATRIGNVFETTVTVPDYNKLPSFNGPIVLDEVQVPAKVKEPTVPLKIVTYGGEGCASYRLATENGVWQDWARCGGNNILMHESSPGLGIKGAFVQVRGANGSISEIKFVKYELVAADGAPDPDPKPVKDTQAPVIDQVSVSVKHPNRSATVKINATDNVGVKMVRLANEDGNWGAWSDFKPEMTHEVTAGKGYKGVFVQVRDAAGNVSTISYTKFTVN